MSGGMWGWLGRMLIVLLVGVVYFQQLWIDGQQVEIHELRSMRAAERQTLLGTIQLCERLTSVNTVYRAQLYQLWEWLGIKGRIGDESVHVVSD